MVWGGCGRTSSSGGLAKPSGAAVKSHNKKVKRALAVAARQTAPCPDSWVGHMTVGTSPQGHRASGPPTHALDPPEITGHA